MLHRTAVCRLGPPLVGMVLCAAVGAVQDNPMLARYQRAERMGSAELGRLVHKARVEPHWIHGTARFWYRNDVRGDRDFVVVDAEAGTRGPAFDHQRVAKALTRVTGQACRAERLPFRGVEFVANGSAIEFRIGDQLWRCDLATYDCTRSGTTALPSRQPVEEPQAEDGRSPDGRWVAFARDGDLWLRLRDTGEECRLTTDGTASDYYGAPQWSPDSGTLVAWRTVPGERLPMYVIDSAPEGSLRPRLDVYEYELPGDRVDVHRLFVFDVATRLGRAVNTDPVSWGGPPEVRWSPDGTSFTFEHTDRGYQRVRVIEVDPALASSRTIIEERSSTFIAPMKQITRYLDATGEIIWSSERDGWNHLYLYDARAGALRTQITRGEWVVRDVVRVDESARTLVFAACGRELGQDPYLIHYYRVGLDGSGLTCLTPGDGHHEVRFSPDGRFLIDTYSRVDRAPVSELRRTADGSLVMVLEEADVADLLAEGWRWPEPFVAQGRDGATDIWGVIFRPTDLDESRQYPVIEMIYAGPQDSFVPKTFAAARAQQELAELGFIVVQIDGMGTSNRSKAFHDVCYRNLGDGGFPDRIAWLRAAAERYPYMDLSRVGIIGHSAGGYNAARALLAFGDFYKVAVAESGNHDHRTDKAWWNELWMGYPVGPHYAEQSNVTQAARLSGKLLLIHGEIDHNVNPWASTMRLADALIAANKDFDLLILPGNDHGYQGHYAKRRAYDYFVRHLLGVEPPKEYSFGGAADAGAECTVTIRNTLDEPVGIYWITFEGDLRKYHDLEPGQEVRQHTYVGHLWEAQTGAGTVSRYTASTREPVWEVGREAE
ncbi:MAG TPA: DPP IV N-terminal domain-containing protein [Armatimonadota bacterium]|nr:DPP IV N-terminal domain-containing protein [Armatimonadota bacterium]